MAKDKVLHKASHTISHLNSKRIKTINKKKIW